MFFPPKNSMWILIATFYKRKYINNQMDQYPTHITETHTFPISKKRGYIFGWIARNRALIIVCVSYERGSWRLTLTQRRNSFFSWLFQFRYLLQKTSNLNSNKQPFQALRSCLQTLQSESESLFSNKRKNKLFWKLLVECLKTPWVGCQKYHNTSQSQKEVII